MGKRTQKDYATHVLFAAGPKPKAKAATVAAR